MEHKIFCQLKFLIIFLFISSIIPKNAGSKIYKRIHHDGSIEYYNKKTIKRKVNFKKKFKSKYNDLIIEISKKYNIDPYLIKCIIKIESNFNPDAVSVAGAMGLMQLMQATARYYNVADPLNPEENLNAGIKHFKELMNYFKNDIPLALAAYHAGIGVVKRRMKIPAIKSTINYVKKIMLLYNGKKITVKKINRLYKRIEADGTLLIYSR